MADDSGPWGLTDFAQHHAGADVARRAAGCLRYLDARPETLDIKTYRRIEERALMRVGRDRLRDERDADLSRLTWRLREAAARRRDAIAAALKRELTGGGYTITGTVGGQRRPVSVDDVAALDVDWIGNALVSNALRFDAVAVTRVAPVERVPRGSAGRPAEYDWEAFAIWLGATVFKDGFPPTKAEFLRKAQQWFAETQDREPSESVLKERLNRFYDACGVGRKS